VTSIDRQKQEITIRYNNGKTETLHMTSLAAAESAAAIDTAGEKAPRIIVYYSDEAGRKTAHYFKKSS
jgi:hypothetical protein